MTTTEVTFESNLLAWCDLGQFWHGEYTGPKPPCPNNPDCNDRRGRYLQPAACGCAAVASAPTAG